jgi:hypothetical protein
VKITSVHICEYSFDDLCQLVDQDLEAQGLRRTAKTPVSRTVEGKETWVFEATSTGGPGPVKPKGKGGRRKKIEVQAETENQPVKSIESAGKGGWWHRPTPLFPFNSTCPG